jgi:hypothetical protein
MGYQRMLGTVEFIENEIGWRATPDSAALETIEDPRRSRESRGAPLAQLSLRERHFRG